MTQEDYLLYVMDILKPMIRHNISIGVDKTLDQYLNIAFQNVGNSYHTPGKWTKLMFWTRENENEFMCLWLKMKPDLLAAIEKHIKVCKNRKLTKDIKSATAYAMIKSAMGADDLRFQYTGQTHRAKVSVLIASNRAITLYIPYKRINEYLPQIMESLKLIKKGMEILDKNTTIDKVYNTDKWE